MHELIQQYGSLRRLFEAYWRGQLTVEQERRVEDNNPKPDVYGMKPIPIKPARYAYVEYDGTDIDKKRVMAIMEKIRREAHRETDLFMADLLSPTIESQWTPEERKAYEQRLAAKS